jgi:hypothetical protein
MVVSHRIVRGVGAQILIKPRLFDQVQLRIY